MPVVFAAKLTPDLQRWLFNRQDEKPRIYLYKGYWRVSPMPKPHHLYAGTWVPAYYFVAQLNNKRASSC